MRSNLVRHLACALAFSAAAGTALAGGGPLNIPNPNPSAGDLFGFSVAAVGLDRVIVGAPGTDVKAGDDGSAYLFDLGGNLLQTYFPEQFQTGEKFGAVVTAVGDDRVLISAVELNLDVTPPLPGRAYLYNLSGSLLDSFINPTSSLGDGFGSSAALGTDAVVIGAPGDDTDGNNTGRAYVFPIGGESGTQTILNPSPDPGDLFGHPVAAIGTDHVAIAAPGAGDVYIFEIPSGDLVETLVLDTAVRSMVWAEATSQLLFGHENDDGKFVFGSASACFLDPPSCIQLEQGVDDGFGTAVAALGNGTHAVGVPLDDPLEVADAGSVALFDFVGEPLGQLTDGSPSAGDQFGRALAASGCDRLIVGTPMGDDVTDLVGPGEVWIYDGLPGGPCSNNYVEVGLARIDDTDNVEAAFEVKIAVVIPDQNGVLGVSAFNSSSEESFFLQHVGNDRWEASGTYFNLDDLQASLQGLWTVETFGSAASGGGAFTTSEFTLSADDIGDGLYFPTPTNVAPADGATGVPINTNFSWADPTGEDTADFLFVHSAPLAGGPGTQQNNSLTGSLLVADTSWNPAQDLLPGANRFEVGYANFDDLGFVGPLMGQSGSIAWGSSPLAPNGYPESTPLLTLGSSTTVGFATGAGSVGFHPPIVTPAAGVPEHESTGDYDGDGDTDVVVTIPDLDPANTGTIQVFLNKGPDQFGEWLGFDVNEPIPVGREPSWVTTGHFNNDPFPDLCVTNAGDDNVSIFLNDGSGNGTFLAAVNVFTGDGPSACTTGQFNTTTDFFLDIAVSNEIDEDLVILFNDGNGNFTLGGAAAAAFVPVGLRTVALTTGDFDGNKCPDAVGSGDAVSFNGTVGQVFVLLGQGNGTFGPPIYVNVGADPRDISVADINGDTFNDIVAANRGDGTISIILGLGGGVFDTPITIAMAGMPRSVDAVNLDGDDDPDIAVVAEGTTTVQVLVNRSGESLGFGSNPVVLDPAVSFPVGGSPNFVVHTDLDGDGLSDLCMVNQNAGPGDGSLSVLLDDLVPVSAEDCPGDIDGDGFVNISDFFLLLESWGPCDAPCDADLDGDGFVGIPDLLMLLQSFGPCDVDRCPWDINGDGVVDFADLFAVLMHVGDCDDPDDCPWDLDGDDFVGFADVLIVLGNFGPCP